MSVDLRPFLAPRSIAVVGAGERPTSSGGAILRLLRECGYKGEVIPVNPKGGQIFGMTARTTLKELPEAADVAVIVIPSDHIPKVVQEAADSGHKHVMVLPGGFAEAGAAGQARERELQRIAAAAGMTISGPNSAGIINLNPSWPVAPAFFRDLPPGPGRHGGIALISQSGALAEEVIAKANADSVPLSAIVSVGNGMHVGIEDFLPVLGADPGISTVFLYVESVADPVRLRDAARRVAAQKPVVALFGGRTGPGALAAQAHTNATPNTDAAIEAFCVDAGIIRVVSLRELLLAAKGFGFYPQGIGRRALLLSNSGGPGVLSTDMSAVHGLEIPPLPNAMADALATALPGEASVGNPLDLLADAREDRFGASLDAAIEYGPSTFDTILGIHICPFMVDAGAVIDAMAARAEQATAAGLAFFHSMMGTLPGKAEWFATMENAGVPTFNDSEAMAECAAILARYPAARARAEAADDTPVSLRGRSKPAG